MARSLPERHRRLVPLVLRALPLLAAAITLWLVVGRHDRLADQQAGLFAMLQEGGLVVLQSGTCRANSRIPTAKSVAAGHCLDAGEHLPFLDDIAQDRLEAAERTRALRTLAAAWRGPGNLLVATYPANIAALTDLMTMPGEAVILRPSATGGDVIGRLVPSG